MVMGNDQEGGRVNETLPLFLDSIYWTLVERLTEFISTPLAGETFSIAGVVRPRVRTARVFVFNGTDLSSTVGIDCPLLDLAGDQIDHFRHIMTLRRVVHAIASGADVETEPYVDSHGFRVVDARAFYEQGDDARVTLRDAIFGSVASVLHRFSSNPPSWQAQIAYPIGFLTLAPAVVRVYFRDPGDRETSGFDVSIVNAEGDFKVAAGGLLRARIRELVGTNMLAGKEISADSDEYCTRAYVIS